MSVFVEEWAATYGSPYLVVPDDSDGAHAGPAEDGEDLRAHDGVTHAAPRLAFVDGVRRVEASLYEVDDTDGSIARGVAGAHACGAVLVTDEARPVYGPMRIARHAIFGSGARGTLPAVAGGWSWQPASIASVEPDAPMAELQARMRQAEGRLAESLCEAGWVTVVDGPLNYVRSRDLPVVGYVKTHTRPLLAPDQQASVPHLLSVGQRTGLFTLGVDRYSCYARTAAPGTYSGPWSGVIRLELPANAGLAACIGQADALAALLPRFAGVPHRDPRAPQNLQPVGALEKHLRHLLGPADLAARAVRDSVILIHRDRQQATPVRNTP